MPEGHTVHRIARELREILVGRPVRAGSPQGRFAREAALLDGRAPLELEAYGKRLFLHWSEDAVVHVHLGMQGKMLRLPPDPPPARPQVRLRLVGDAGGADLIAPMRCELLARSDRDRLVASMGPDPLRDDADPGRAIAAFAASSQPVGALLLDQAVIAGIGNVFRAEALYAVGVHPLEPGEALDTATLEALWRTVRDMMRRAVNDGRIVTRRPAGIDPLALPEGDARFVYKRERCAGCGAPVEAFEIGTRTAYACTREQTLARPVGRGA